MQRIVYLLLMLEYVKTASWTQMNTEDMNSTQMNTGKATTNTGMGRRLTPKNAKASTGQAQMNTVKIVTGSYASSGFKTGRD